MKTKVSARFVIGYQGQDHVVYENGEMVFEDDQVIFVGHNYPGEVDEHIQAGNAILSPGFVDLNALADIDTTVMSYDQPAHLGSGMSWSERYLKAGPRETATPEEEAFKFRYALTQLVFNGITTALPVTGLTYKKWAETKTEFERVAQAAVELGLRVYLGPSYRSGVNVIHADGSRSRYWDEQAGLDGLEGAVEFIRAHDNTHDGMVHGLLVPSTIDTCTPDLLVKTKQYADELNVPIRLHAAQSYREFKLIQADFQKTPIQHLHALGFLGAHTIIPHAIYVNGYSREDCGEGPDLEILKDTRAIVAYCPFAVARGGHIMESFERYKNLGIRVGMGTDCYPSDMLMNMRLGSMLCRFADDQSDVATTADMYRSATLWGADALNRSDLGRLAPGAKADFFIASLDGFHVGQVDDPIRTLVLYCNNTDIQTVVINGKMVMKDRSIANVNKEAYSQRAQAYYQNLKNSYSDRDYLQRPTEVLFPESFKIIRKA
jgi:cytosine/adenosine deaminase-related metal-dependent hydrolase